MRARTARTALAAALLASASIPALAGGSPSAGQAVVRVAPLGRDKRRSAVLELPVRADVVGATWHGRAGGELQVRVRTARGGWSRWVHLEAGEHAPDPSTREARTASTRTASDPIWVGDADAVQVRTLGQAAVRDLRIVALDASSAGLARSRTPLRAVQRSVPKLGTIRLREAWGALEPKAAPAYADAVRGVVIHHTDNANGYSCAQVPALLRAIQRYHMTTQGWNDIGYNFVIDRCGGIWEGRAGGIDQAVLGAHTFGFNTRTSGIALLGTHGVAAPTARARLALRRLVAWRLDAAHVKPNSSMLLTAAATGKFAAGATVKSRAVSGHRDLFATSCPGAAEYRDLAALAAQAWRTGGAKVANITTSHRLRSPSDPSSAALAQVTARAVTPFADEYVAFRFERISTGQVLRVIGGRGLVRVATWNVPAGLSLPAWDVRVVVSGARPNGQRALPATVALQQVGDDPALAVTAPPASTVAPGGDPLDDEIALAYTLALDYRLQAELVDSATGALAATLLAPTYVGPTGDAPRELRLPIPDFVPAGSYVLRLSLPADRAAGRSVREFPISVVR